jgi:cytochrome c biogenesis protein
MTQLSRAAAIERPATAASVASELDSDAAFSPSGALEWLWATFTSMRLALALMLGLALLGLAGSLIIQAPAGVASDQAAYNAWLQGLKPKYGGFTIIFDKLGLLSVFSSVWFRGLAVALTTSILACSIKRAPTLWKAAVHPRTRMTDTFYEAAPYNHGIVTQATPQDALTTTQRVFRANRYRTIVDVDEKSHTAHLYVDQNRWAPFGTVIAHLSVVVILIGGMAGSMLGYRDEGFAVPVGSTVPVGGGTGLSVLAASFSDSYNSDTGAPSDYASNLVLYRDGVQVAAKTIRVNDPLEFEGTAFYQSFFGPAAVMTISDASGASLYHDGVPLLWSSDDDSRRIGQMTLSAQNIMVYVVGAASGRVDPRIRPGQMQLEIYRGGEDQPFAIEILTQGQPLAIDGLTYTFEREQQFTGLIVSRDPGQPLVWLGALALVLGCFLVFMFPNRRIWAQIKARSDGTGEVHLGATARHDAAFAPEFTKLVDQVRLAFGPAA